MANLDSCRSLETTGIVLAAMRASAMKTADTNQWKKMSNLTRYWYKRTWTPAQKKKILLEIEKAKEKDKKLGTRGEPAEVCRKYKITTAHITIWRKQFRKAVESGDAAWLISSENENA